VYYEITERGKIIIAVVLVSVLIVMSTIILTINSCSGTSSINDPPQTFEPSSPPDDDPSISDGPLPTPGSGFDPTTPDVTPTPTPTPTPTETPPSGNGGNGNGYNDNYIDFGPVGLNLTEGTMQFIFSTSLQETLDDDTVTMLSDFLKSPKNTADAQVQVEMPNLTDDDVSILMSAVTKAFLTYNVSANDIVFVKNQNKVTEGSFEVKLSFYVAPDSK